MLRAIVITLLFLVNLYPQILLAASKPAKHDPQTLLRDVQYLLSAEETMDYDDPKLQEILSQYDYHLFKAYKAFIEFDRSGKTGADLVKAKKALVSIHKSVGHGSLRFVPQEVTQESIMRGFTDLLTSGYATVDDLEKDLPAERKKNWHNGYKYIKIPLWLVMKYPAIASHIDGVYTLVVNAEKSVRDIAGFKEFLSIIHDIRGGFISTMYGYQRFDSYLMTKHFIDVISFNPAGYISNISSRRPCSKKPTKERFSALAKWARGSEEKMLKYQEFLICFDQVAQGLREYYQNNYNLEQYADRAEDILSYYVYEHTHRINDRGSCAAP